jgi:N-ethylmaleimide reductase
VALGPYLLTNRVVMAAMTRRRAGASGVPTPLMATYYAQRASAGLIVTEATYVAPQGGGAVHSPGIHTDEQAAAWRLVTDAVHARGGRIFLQLWHAGRVSHPAFQPDGGPPWAPSAVPLTGEIVTPDGKRPFVTPRALDASAIAATVNQFADAARRARAAAFDGVEIHAAQGYLIDQFLRDGTNRRTDAYGGAPERRTRFLLEVVRAVADAWGPGRVGVQLSPTSPLNDMSDSDPVATFSHAAGELGRVGLAYLHVFEPVDPQAPRDPPVTALLRARFPGPLIANGSYTRAGAEAAIARGAADLVSFGRPFIANPDLPARFAAGAALAEPDRTTFYGGDARGYTDYPPLDGGGAG